METTRERGFSLIEVLVAMSVLAAAFGSLAQLVVVSAQANQRARIAAISALAAQDKAEELRGVAAEAHGSAGSPVGSVEADVPGYCDFLDARGRLLPDGQRARAVYARRWSIGGVARRPTLVAWHVRVTAARAGTVHLAGFVVRPAVR